MMVRVLGVVFVVAALIAGGSWAELTSAQEPVSVNVRVVNGTAGAEPPAAVPI